MMSWELEFLWKVTQNEGNSQPIRIQR